MNILHVYTDKRVEEQQETKRFVSELSTLGYRTHSVLATGESHYWKALRSFWLDDDLIVIEQDIVSTEQVIRELIRCHFDACTVPYCVDGHWSIGESLYGIDNAVGPTGPTNLGELQTVATKWYHRPFPKLAPVSSFGLVKISRRLQFEVSLDDYPVPGRHWSLIDSWFSAVLTKRIGLEWHVHDHIARHNH